MVSESHHRKIAHQMVRRLPKNTVIVPGAGRPCPRCQRPMQIREHFTITENELRRPFYFRILYRCLNDAHKTTVVSFEEDREFYPAGAAPSSDPGRQVAKSGGGAAGGLPHDAGLMFRHLERGAGESFAVGGGPASARALQLARKNNVNRPYQIPNELGHVPTELGDYAWRQPYRKASDEQARGGRSYDDGGDVGDTGDAQNPDKNLQADLEPGTIDTYVLRNISRMIHVF